MPNPSEAIWRSIMTVTVSVIDSILWGGSATKGRQFAVTSGYVDDARPSTLFVTYSDVQGGRTSVAAHVEDGCSWMDQ